MAHTRNRRRSFQLIKKYNPQNTRDSHSRCWKIRRRMSTPEDPAGGIANDILSGHIDTAIDNLLALSPSDRRSVTLCRFGDQHLTPLHLLALSTAPRLPPDAMHRLLNVASDSVTAVDADGNTLLHLLVRSGRQEDLATLLESGRGLSTLESGPGRPLLSMVDRYNDEGRTALHEAALRGQTMAVEALMACGADASAKALKTGLSALHWAVLADHGADTVVRRLLIGAGLEFINATTFSGATALDLAKDNGVVGSVLEMLERAGCVFENSLSSEEDEDEEEEEEETEFLLRTMEFSVGG